MRYRFLALVLGAAISAAGSAPADAIQSCSANRTVCESVCTPDRIARYHGGLARRCTASCEPRWQQCLRTGVWVDLERRSSGWWEQARRL